MAEGRRDRARLYMWFHLGSLHWEELGTAGGVPCETVKVKMGHSTFCPACPGTHRWSPPAPWTGLEAVMSSFMMRSMVAVFFSSALSDFLVSLSSVVKVWTQSVDKPCAWVHRWTLVSSHTAGEQLTTVVRDGVEQQAHVLAHGLDVVCLLGVPREHLFAARAALGVLEETLSQQVAAEVGGGARALAAARTIQAVASKRQCALFAQL